MRVLGAWNLPPHARTSPHPSHPASPPRNPTHQANCPNCGTENFTYFGDILTVGGNREDNVIECASCKAKLKYERDARMVTVSEMPAEKAAA